MNDPSIAVAMLGSGSRRRTAPSLRTPWFAVIARRLHALLHAVPRHG
jgi:hypothetical protein